jgi:hypothetical protein
MKEAHMSFKKKMLAVAAAGALSALAAVPAMAFENEFHGMFALKYFLSDYETGGSGYINPQLGNPTYTPGAVQTINRTDNLKMNNYFEQRARIFYTAKASDDLKLVTGFEIDSVWGDKAQGGLATTNNVANNTAQNAAFRNSGGGMEADAVNLETKWVYLDFKIPSTPTQVKAGIQAYKDPFKGVFLDADLAGVNTITKVGNLTANLAYFRAYDNSFFSTDSNRPRGVDNLQFVVADGKYAVNKDINVGAAYIGAYDNRNTTSAANGTADFTTVNVFGLYGDAKIGKLSLSGFAAGQQGYNSNNNSGEDDHKSNYLNGWAFNVTGKMPVGPGTFKTAVLYTSGSNDGDNGWQAISQRVAQSNTNPAPGSVANQNFSNLQSSGCNSYNDSGMMLLNRNTAAQGTSTDNSIVYSTNNKNQGVWLYSLGYDATITPKLYTNVNAGFAWVAKDNANKPVDRGSDLRGGSNFLGTEVNIETGYKMYDNLTAAVQAAYVILGGYYTNTIRNGAGNAVDPENPYTARVVLSYAF